MSYNPTPPPGDRRDKPNSGIWGAVGLAIVGLVAVLAVMITLLGPTNTQQANNVPVSPSANPQTEQPISSE